MPCDSLPGGGDPAICEVGGSGLFLPLGGDGEQQWPTELRAVLYLLGLLWCFMGVAIIADVFMGAIEKITSKKMLRYDPKLKKRRTVTIWNPTVANLTLMALGSSAPEILLNVIGIFPTFQSSDLGPSTIVGSAAFNLLCITAVCVVSIPAGEVRKIKDLGVFAFTAFFSVFAYVWLLVILMLITPDVVDTAEGVLTFLFFPLLVLLAYLADVGKIPGTEKELGGLVVQPESSKQELAEMEHHVRNKYGKNVNLTAEQVSVLMDYEFFQPHSRAKHRVNATRGLFAGRRVLNDESNFEKGAKLSRSLLSANDLGDIKTIDSDKPEVSFKALNYTVLESVGSVKISVKCFGKPMAPFQVRYSTRDGTAHKGSDYKEKSGVLDFGPNLLEATIEVAIIQSQGHEETEEFYVDLQRPEDSSPYVLGHCETVTVVIIDEDHPGKICFEEEQKEIPGSVEQETLNVKVIRKSGSSGKVSCKYKTESDSAIAGADFEEVEGTLEFECGQTSAFIEVNVYPKGRYEGTESFRIILTEAENGATFDSTTDGGRDMCILTVIITADNESKSRIDQINNLIQVNWDAVEIGNANWKEQFTSALYVNGSADEQKESSWQDCIMHVLALPWKLLFALVPPTEYAGGWVCFFAALLMVGFVTCIIGDMAELLGCVLNIKPATTAITLVALGTSLPDTFASRTAAMQEPYADNSIGNVTGSNSVNVFLGLGLPWMIAAVYWQFFATCTPGDTWYAAYPEVAPKYPDGMFVVKAGSLSSSVTCFSICACLCIGTLVARRVFLGGELGGPKHVAWLTAAFFVSLWLVYIIVSIALGD